MESEQLSLDGFGPEQEKIEEQGPVVVLGRTFANDDERRRVFRDELRAMLPQLRQIEGFPIGTDDDIINLSDPPYYTACPNPWLNDFIAEWEKEKKQLEAEGKRMADFEVKEPYASDVSEGKFNPVYMAHTYHTKVPHPAIMRYILHYTQPGDIIFDGFAGTGMTGVAAQACDSIKDEYHSKIENEYIKIYGKRPRWGKRHAICGDLSPYASIISYNYNTPPQTKLFKQEVNNIIKELEDEYGWLYTINHEGSPIGRMNCLVWSEVMSCINCGHEFSYWDVAMDHEHKKLLDTFECPICHSHQTKKTANRVFQTIFDDATQSTIRVIKLVPVLLVYSVGNKRFTRTPHEDELALLNKISETPIHDFFPTDELPDGYNTEQPKIAQGYCRVHQFFSRRNLIILAALNKKINHSRLPNKLRFVFTGIINRSAMMNRMQINYYFNGGGGWCTAQLKGTLYVPKFPIEISIFEQLLNKIDSYIEAAPLLPSKYDNVIDVASADHTCINNNSIDYIFTDPPFGANINYSELNCIPEYWLKVVTNNDTEAVENNAQGKNAFFYHAEMQKCFSEYYRILKPGKWMTVEFSNTKASIWNLIQSSITEVGFIIVNVASLDKKQGSYKSLTTTTAVKQDLVITCFKPSSSLTNRFESSGDKSENVWNFIDEFLEHLPIHIQQKENTTAIIERSPKILYDRLIAYYVQHGYPVPMDAVEFQKGLRQHFVERDGMFFTPEQAIEYDEKKRLAPQFVSLGLMVGSESEGIEWLKNRLREHPQTYQELQPQWMQDLVTPKKGDTVPELMQILEENFLKNEAGQWYIPDLEKAADLEKVRMRKNLKEFESYVELASKAKGRIKNARLFVLQDGFKHCYQQGDFKTIILVGNHIDESLLTEDEILLQYYDIASSKVQR